MGKKGYTGFSLPEFLVVLAIVAILAAILFPVFLSARGKARQTECLSHERQILLAVIQYAQDADGMLPRLAEGTPPVGPLAEQADRAVGLEDLLDPYIKAGRAWGPERADTVWACPEDPIRRDDCDGKPGVGVGFTISYGFTSYTSDPSRGFGVFAVYPGTDSRTLSQIGRLDDTIVLFEEYGPDLYSRWRAGYRDNNADVAAWPLWPHFFSLGDRCGDGYDWRYAIGGHAGLTNFGFADGHVKALRHGSVMSVRNGIWDGSRPNRLHWDEAYH